MRFSKKDFKDLSRMVLILIVMEDTLWDLDLSGFNTSSLVS